MLSDDATIGSCSPSKHLRMEKATDYHRMSARSISKDVARRRGELAAKLRAKKVQKRKRLEKKRKRQEGIRVVAESLAEDGGRVESNGPKLVVLADVDEELRAPSKRKRKRNIERDNRIWRNFNRFGVDGTDRNAAFAEYYSKQLAPLLPSKEDWSAFISSLSTDLPVTFRLNSGKNPVVAASLCRRLQGEFQFKGSFVRTQDKVISGKVTKGLSWFGTNHSGESGASLWQVNTSRAGFAKCEVLKPLYDVITREARLGNLARQECASMLPALALKVRGHHAVLDLCASPGSKTEHVLELMKQDKNADGVVVANDADEKRLKHMERRFAHAGDPKLVITCCGGESLAQAVASSDPGKTHERFDRVICDVPCSGDGTLRKMPYLWRRWRLSRAIDLYPLQLELLKNAASVLKPGGRLVYSTCSLNPVENEAVVLAFLRVASTAFKLVPSELPAKFKLRQGLVNWHGEDFERAGRGPSTITKVACPKDGEAEAFHLDLCCRVFPQDNDTGGFFLAVLEKIEAWTINLDDCKNKLRELKNATKVLREAGYTVQQRGKDSKASKILQLQDLDLNLREEVNKSLLANASSVVLRTSLETAEDRRSIFALSNSANAAVKTWCRGLPIVSAGVRVGWTHADGMRFSPCAYGVHNVPNALKGGDFQVRLDDFNAILNMINEVVSTTADTEVVGFPIEWLCDLCETSEVQALVDATNRMEVGALFSVSCEVSINGSGDARRAKHEEKSHRRLSKNERKRLKKRRKQGKGARVALNIQPENEPIEGSNRAGVVRIILAKGKLQLQVVTPLDVLESLDEALSS